MFTPIAGAAKALNVSERFLRQLIADNRIPFYRLSPRTLRVDLNELRDYMRLIAEGKPDIDEEKGSNHECSRPIPRRNPVRRAGTAGPDRSGRQAAALFQ
jgi:excisionase family DNA binding protein